MTIFGRLRTVGVVYEIEERKTTIGRDPDSDIVLEKRGISRHHAILEFSGTRTINATLTDLDSINGTFVNGNRLTPNEPHVLHTGDTVVFSAYEKVHYTFEDGDTSPARSPSPEGASIPPAKEAMITIPSSPPFVRSPRRTSTQAASTQVEAAAPPEFSNGLDRLVEVPAPGRGRPSTAMRGNSSRGRSPTLDARGHSLADNEGSAGSADDILVAARRSRPFVPLPPQPTQSDKGSEMFIAALESNLGLENNRTAMTIAERRNSILHEVENLKSQTLAYISDTLKAPSGGSHVAPADILDGMRKALSEIEAYRSQTERLLAGGLTGSLERKGADKDHAKFCDDLLSSSAGDGRSETGSVAAIDLAAAGQTLTSSSPNRIADILTRAHAALLEADRREQISSRRWHQLVTELRARTAELRTFRQSEEAAENPTTGNASENVELRGNVMGEIGDNTEKLAAAEILLTALEESDRKRAAAEKAARKLRAKYAASAERVRGLSQLTAMSERMRDREIELSESGGIEKVLDLRESLRAVSVALEKEKANNEAQSNAITELIRLLKQCGSAAVMSYIKSKPPGLAAATSSLDSTERQASEITDCRQALTQTKEELETIQAALVVSRKELKASKDTLTKERDEAVKALQAFKDEHIALAQHRMTLHESEMAHAHKPTVVAERRNSGTFGSGPSGMNPEAPVATDSPAAVPTFTFGGSTSSHFREPRKIPLPPSDSWNVPQEPLISGKEIATRRLLPPQNVLSRRNSGMEAEVDIYDFEAMSKSFMDEMHQDSMEPTTEELN